MGVPIGDDVMLASVPATDAPPCDKRSACAAAGSVLVGGIGVDEEWPVDRKGDASFFLRR
jgi:hypothetical protein